MLSQYVTAFEVQVQDFPYNSSCGSLLDSFKTKVEGPEVKVGGPSVKIEQRTRTKVKAVL